MALINTEIAQQAFEIIRDRIGEILAEELANQYAISGNEDLNTEVWVERIVAFDKTECPAVNVMLDSGDYDNQDAVSVDGTYLYHIDCYAQAKTTDNQDGDTTAMLNLQRLMGVCRAILEDAQYIRLGFAPPFIMNTSVMQIGFADIRDLDATSTVMGRLVFSVKAPETVALVQPVVLDSHKTSVQLELTEKGFLYIYQES